MMPMNGYNGQDFNGMRALRPTCCSKNMRRMSRASPRTSWTYLLLQEYAPHVAGFPSHHNLQPATPSAHGTFAFEFQSSPRLCRATVHGCEKCHPSRAILTGGLKGDSYFFSHFLRLLFLLGLCPLWLCSMSIAPWAW